VNEPTIALVFTPDPWVEELHRHCTDHGGARVRQVLIDAALALEEQYDVLFASHRWPALTRGLLEDVHARGRRVLGVFDRDQPVGHDLLVELGADATVASDAGPAGIVAALRSVHEHDHEAPAPDARPPAGQPAARPGTAVRTVVSGPAGAGTTEIAIALAASVAGAVLVDANDVSPAVAPRLGLAIEPNFRTAVDTVEYAGGALEDHLQPIGPASGARVLAGLPSVATWPQVRPTEALRLVERLAASCSWVVVDAAGALEDLPVPMARPRHAVTRALLAEADEIVAVGAAGPVGVARLLAWIGDVRALAPRAVVHAVLNRAPKDEFRRGELVDEVGDRFGVASVSVVPHDRRVMAAAWDGAVVARSPFTRAVARLVATLDHARGDEEFAS
jgi:MinD-like ATPase involved in chromosome partitioning or flagellar assembly